MNFRLARFGAVFSIAAAALAACGSGPASDLNFQAPSGWMATPSMFAFQMWIKPGTKNTGQVVFLFRAPPGSKNSDFDLASSQFGSARVVARKTIAICGKQPAQFVRLTGRSHQGTSDDVDLISTSYGGTRYMSMYARPASGPADPQADAAIHSLCLKR